MSPRKAPTTMPRPEAIPPVAPDQFQFGVLLASAAFGYRMPMDSPAKQGVTLRMEDGSTCRLAFTDIPENRAMIAMRDHFGGDHEAFFAAAMRFFALMRVWKSPRNKAWLRPAEDDPRSIMVHDAVFRSAARVPLNAEGCFDEGPFFAQVEEYAAADEQPPSRRPRTGAKAQPNNQLQRTRSAKARRRGPRR